jgi:branched-chain amino acid transport system permease protein
MVQHRYPAVLACAAAILVSAILGSLLARLLVRLRGLYMAMGTVAVDVVLTVIYQNGGSLTGGAVGLYDIPVVLNTGTLAVIVVLVALALAWRERGDRGRIAEAVRLDPDRLAPSLGIEVYKHRQRAFVLGCVLGAVSGVMNALLFNALDPTAPGFNLISLALAMVVLGGSSSWLGAYVGAVIVSWLPTFLGSFVGWEQPIYGGLLIIMIVYAPDGLAGAVRRPMRRLAVRLTPGIGRGFGLPAYVGELHG